MLALRRSAPATVRTLTRAMATEAKMVTFKIAGECEGTRAVVKARTHEFVMDEPKHLNGTDTGMNPLEATLSALTGCKTITMGSIARRLGLKIGRITVPSVEGSFDPRGFMGVPGVKAGFQVIKMEMVVHDTDATQEQLDELLSVTSQCCPVASTMHDAGVQMDVTIRAA